MLPAVQAHKSADGPEPLASSADHRYGARRRNGQTRLSAGSLFGIPGLVSQRGDATIERHGQIAESQAS